MSVPLDISVPELINGVKIFNYDTNTESIYTSAYIQFSLKDKEYLELAKNPVKNESRLNEMVAEKARESGFPTKVYHGTAVFGFTKADVKKSDDAISFFATDSLALAQTYSGVSGETSLKKGNGQSAANQETYNNAVSAFVNKVKALPTQEKL